MADDFDPYYKWLAIPPAEQPPNHYRLLGVPPYTDDPDVIENAADQRMSHLRSFQSGRYSQESQRLLNEVATARVTLLELAKKDEYDAQLRRESPAMPMPLPPPVPPPIEVGTPDAIPSLEAAGGPAIQSRPAKRRAKSPFVELLKHVAASATGLLCGYLVVGFFSPSWDHFELFHRKPVHGTEHPVAEKPLPENAATGEPVTRPVKTNPSPPRPEKEPEPPKVKPAVKPVAPIASGPSAAELARQADEAKRERLATLEMDRDAAVAEGNVVEALKLTVEYAKLKELDPLVEKGRVIDELRKTDHSPEETFILTGAVMEQARHALENNQKAVAVQRAEVALQLARKSNDQELVKQATRLVLEIQQ